MISAICSGVILAATPMPTENVQISATGGKSSKSEGNIVGIKSVIVDGKEYPISFLETPAEGSWYYSKNDGAYLWLNESDERLKEPIPQQITIKIPVGAGRKLVFLSGKQFGKVQVTYGNESEEYSLYRGEAKDKTISVPDSSRIYDDFIKLCRLGGYALMIVAALLLAIWLTKRMEKDRIIKLLYMILSLVTTLTFFLNFGLTNRSGITLYHLLYDFIRSFAGNFVLAIILVPMLYKTFCYCGALYREHFSSVRGTLCIALPAGLFAAFMIIGMAFVNGKDTLSPIFDNELQILKSLFGFVGYFAVLFFGITWIFYFLDCLDIYKISNRKRFKPVQMYLDSLTKRPFITTFLTLIILYIPYIIVSYPGILTGDAPDQFGMTYERYELHNAHPVTHTLFLKFCVKTGEAIFQTANAGLFLYSMLQFLFIIAIVSLSVKLLCSCKVSSRILLLLIAYYAFHPRVRYWMFLMTKDIINAAFLLIFMVALYMILAKKSTPYIYLTIAIGDVGAILFRHDSRYVIIISLVLILFMVRDFRKVGSILLAGTIGFVLLWNGLLSYLNIEDVKPWNKEYEDIGFLGSIMAQQTARYVRDAGDEVTPEEREIIDAIYDYDKILSVYQPGGFSDGMLKNRRKSDTPESMQNYKAVWLKMFWKHPEIYLEATLNHKYQFLYPTPYTTNYYSYATSAGNMNTVNNEVYEQTADPILKLHYPVIPIRDQIQSLREQFFRIPIFNLLYTTASFFWVLFIWLAYCVLHKNKISVSLMMLLLVMVLVLIAGPSSGMYARYCYPYMLCLPIVIVLGLHNIKQQTMESSLTA